MAYDPLQCVRDSCEDVVKRAVDVSIDDDKLKLLAEELAPNSSFNPFVTHTFLLTTASKSNKTWRQAPVEGL